MAVSKVVLGNETLIDLTGDSVSSENLLQGATAHAANGEQITGGVVVTPMYTGTKAAIEEAIALGQIPEDAVVNITDDEETSSFQTQINEINSSLSSLNTNLVCVKYDGSLSNAYSFYLYKRNNDVYLNGYFSGSFSKNSIITTLPEGFRPKTKLSGVVAMSRPSSSAQYISGADVDINTDGTIVSTNDTSWVAIMFNNKFPIDI